MRKFKAPQYNTRHEINVDNIRLEGVEGVFSVTYLPQEMCLVTYYHPKEKGQVTMAAYSIKKRNVTTEGEILDRDVIFTHLGQALLEFSKESSHSVDDILPGFVEGLAHKIRKDEEEKNSSFERLIKEREKHKQRISVSPKIRKLVSSRLREARQNRLKQMDK